MTPLPLSALFFLLPLLSLSNAHKAPRRGNSPHDRARRNLERAQPAPEVEDELHSFDNRTLVERDTYTGIGTYYYTGLGACGLTSSDSDLMVAMNSDQYGSGYPGPQCFKYISIEAEGTTVSGIEVLDECPTCDYGSLDLSPGLFTHFAGTDAGTITITWWFEGDSSSSTSTSSTPTTTWTPTTTTSQYVAPTTSSTSEWQAPSSSSSSTSQWTPSTSATPSSTSQWSQPAVTSSSTQTSTSSAAWSTITTSSSSWSASANSTVISTSAVSNTTNSFAEVASDTTSASATGSGSSAASSDGSSGSGSSSSSSDDATNLVNFNALVAQYGQLVVKAASG